MSDAAESQTTEQPAPEAEVKIPTPEELAVVPPERDAYFVKPDGTKVTGDKGDKDGKPKTEPKPDGEEPPPAAADAEKKPEADKPEEERAPTAKEIANAKRYRKDLAKREREIQREAERVASERAEWTRLQTMRRENPRALLDELGLSFRELAEEAVKQDGEDPRDKAIRELRQELSELKGFKEDISKERATQREQAAFQADVDAVAERIKVDAEAYPYLAAYGESRAALAAVNGFYARERAGQSADLIEILDSLESELRTDYERISEAQKKRNGNGSSLAAQAKAPGRVNGAEQSAKHVADTKGTPSPALTNRNAAERASPDRRLSRDERMRLAASRLVVRD